VWPSGAHGYIGKESFLFSRPGVMVVPGGVGSGRACRESCMPACGQLVIDRNNTMVVMITTLSPLYDDVRRPGGGAAGARPTRNPEADPDIFPGPSCYDMLQSRRFFAFSKLLFYKFQDNILFLHNRPIVISESIV
jgi:hypothetical protein